MVINVGQGLVLRRDTRVLTEPLCHGDRTSYCQANKRFKEAKGKLHSFNIKRLNNMQLSQIGTIHVFNYEEDFLNREVILVLFCFCTKE